MCTVTYVPLENGALICSNRDEKMGRPRALPPRWQEVNGARLLFPKDTLANGTWIAMKPNGNMAVLLNGGWVKHIPAHPYHKSRGLVFLDIASSDDMISGFENVSLEGIEPFTVILLQEGYLQENRWDGHKKYSRFLPASEPGIWSSVTLYEDEVIAKRRSWFEEWLDKNPCPTPEDIQHFHRFGGNGDRHNDLLMNRNNEMLTVSITCMENSGSRAGMYYTDLQSSERFDCLFDVLTFSEATP